MQERVLLDTVVGVPSSRVSMKLLRAVPRTVRGRAPACGLRPDCNAVTVAVQSPEEKKRTKKTTTFQEQETSDGEQDKRAKKQHHNGITSSGSSKQPYSVFWMRGVDGGDAVVGSLSWQLLQTSAVHCIIGDQ